MRKLFFLSFLIIWMAIPAWGADATNSGPAKGSPLPRFELPMPSDPDERTALGLAGDRDRFSLADIDARLVIIEIFSMYCPICQREAPRVNEFHDLLQKSPSAADIKLIGIGAGNSGFEVDYFKKTYSIPFPLFADGDFSIHKQVGEVRTPFFIMVRRDPSGHGQPVVVATHAGPFDDPQAFLDQAAKLARKK